jgi:hypothetical protein
MKNSAALTSSNGEELNHFGGFTIRVTGSAQLKSMRHSESIEL